MRFLYGCLTIFFLAIILLGGSAAYVVYNLQDRGPLETNKSLVIAKGSNANAIAQRLEQEGIISSAFYFKLQYFLEERPEVKAGEYMFTPHMTLAAIIDKLVRGDIVKRKYSVPEGLTSAEIVQILNNEAAMTGTIAKIPPEGSMLPDTYQYVLGDDRNEKIKEMQKAMQEAVLQIWVKRDVDNILTSPEQLVNLASIVEKETGLVGERPRVAGVFMNRLRRNMMLQSDPTAAYGITNGKAPLGRPLTTADLKVLNPYNTYMIIGLPIGPIANPGKAAMMAVAKPEKNDFLYFVADGTGGHAFATTLAEHEKNVAAWRKLNK